MAKTTARYDMWSRGYKAFLNQTDLYSLTFHVLWRKPKKNKWMF